MGMLRIFLALALAASTGCATWSRPALERPPYLQALARQGVDEETLVHISGGRVLGYHDIVALVEAGVPGAMIVPYLKATRTPYDFSSRQISSLVTSGADDVLINFLGKAKGIYLEDAGNVPTTTGAADDLHPYWADPGFAGGAPFDFAFPDEWYDSDYWRGSGQDDRRGGR